MLSHIASVSTATTAFMESREPEIVVTDGDRFVGVVSYKKIISKLQKGHFENLVINLVREQVQTVSQSETIDQLFELFHRSDQHIFPVVDSSRIVGSSPGRNW